MGIISAGVTLDFLIGKASGHRTLTTRLWRAKPVGTSNVGPAWLPWAALQWTGDKRWQFCDDTPKTSHSGEGVRINSPAGLFGHFSHNLRYLVHIKFEDLIGTVLSQLSCIAWNPIKSYLMGFLLFISKQLFVPESRFLTGKTPSLHHSYILYHDLAPLHLNYSAAFLSKTWVSFLLKVSYK